MDRQATNDETAPATQRPPSSDFAYRGPDRRKRPTPRFSRYSLWGGRRKDPRRDEERSGSFVDLYEAGMLFPIGLVALLNIADCFFTLVHLQQGGFEVNPIADALLKTGRLGFVALKVSLIGLALVILTLHKNFWMAQVGLWGAAGAYSLLTLYHVYLFFV
ncbi:MAG: DUF5658 family protein [Planctomycetota bacterium]